MSTPTNLFDYKQSQYRLRKALGILGFALPILLIINHDQILASMSHYYYTSSSIFFISILSAFGLVLFTYRGYPKEADSKEILSDDLITTLAAICILIAVIIPTSSGGSLGRIYFHGFPYLMGYEGQAILNTVHLSSAGLFLILLGYMCYFKFTKSKNNTRFNALYKACGVIIWASVGILLILFALGHALFGDAIEQIPYVFIFEWVAVYAFSLAWLLKGRIQDDMQSLLSQKNK